MRRLVIVGASLAGLRAAQAARTAGFDGELVVVGEEVHRPYTRPPLSKELLAGEHDVERVALPSDTFEAEWHLGVPATRLDRARRRVVLADGSEVPYDRLILATGSRARRWPGPGGELKGVHVLRSLDDAIALRAAFGDRPRVAIVGAGFIGCEVAQTARKQGLDVTLIDVAPTPMLPLGPQLGKWCADLHRDHGVDVRLATGVAGLHGNGRFEAVELTDGTRVEADLVVVGLGAHPNTEWLADSGLRLTPGLECDATLTAVGDPDVLGAGDIVSWPHPLAGGDSIRIEHWTVAAEQGQHAGRNALLEAEQRTPYDQPPYFWSDQYDTKIQSLGLPGLAERLELLEATEDGSRFVYGGERDGRLVGVIAINAARRLGSYRMALADRPDFKQLQATIAADTKRLS
ncbi:NAD(P)/FAD-dependent oxidoreductase [Solirubrobacter soli]|uniref:NAD(P)/FAD-dependent oxidoreductase n=1 Tax=Solirubrobacter soli TaxID=363832 RepID=UPI000422443F|nr:FAD-dependent oxidoreductase [Solirubrobacter soli]